MKNAKKFMGLAMVLLMVLSLAPTAVYADNTGNLLTNGGFETVTEDSWPEDWDIPTGSSYAETKKGTNVFATKEKTHSGDYALQVIPGTGKRRVYQKVENLTAGNFYEASVWVLVTEDFSDASDGPDLLVMGNASSGWDTENRWASTTTNQAYKVKTTYSKWTKMTTYWQQPADETTASVVFDIGAVDDDGSACYFDDAKVREITGFDGGFETGFETVSTEKISDDQYIQLPHDIAFMHRPSNSMAAYAGEVEASTIANSGNYGLHMITNTTGRRAFLYVPNLTPGKTYKLTAYMNVTEELAGGANIYVGPYFDKAASTLWLQPTAQTAVTNGWLKREHCFTVGTDLDGNNCNYAYILLYAGKAKDDSADVYFDDITIEESNIKFTDTEGTVLEETISAAGTVIAKATVAGAKGDVARMIVGVYDTVNGTPCLAEVYVSESITLGNTKWKEITIENISLSAGQYAKAVLLDGAAGLKPLTEAKTLTVESAS